MASGLLKFLDIIDYVKSELGYSDAYINTLLSSKTNTVLASLSSSDISALKSALISLQGNLTTYTDDLTTMAIAVEQTIEALKKELTTSTIMRDINIVNNILTYDITSQDFALHTAIPVLTNVSLQSVQEQVEVNYRYNQAVLQKSSIAVKKNNMLILSKNIENIIAILNQL